MTSSPFEGKIVRILNAHFLRNKIRAESHRVKQSRFGGQKIDVLSDSMYPRYYLGIECKSIEKIDKDGNENKNIYFTQHFTVEKKTREHQVPRLARYIYQSGRLGVLAVELRTEGSKHNEVYFVLFDDVLNRWNAHEKGLPVEWMRKYPKLISAKRGWNVEQVLDGLWELVYKKIPAEEKLPMVERRF